MTISEFIFFSTLLEKDFNFIKNTPPLPWLPYLLVAPIDLSSVILSISSGVKKSGTSLYTAPSTSNSADATLLNDKVPPLTKTFCSPPTEP